MVRSGSTSSDGALWNDLFGWSDFIESMSLLLHSRQTANIYIVAQQGLS